ncbi:DNA-binding FadR family transcriptional regulator [Actinocorallia herbida]|uniref:DNA-binding FadR family transcriptional regulator n=1 Tax=Actinocorallia herbida TaxID=58109 RepID=A0A3N1CSZ7_9ACTN|nr:FCD domain-containing protein [Actinocorallia herbida]ROO84304.1 DNA-binding FadR family transcriptional regulator [Actinocorallia herbida]
MPHADAKLALRTARRIEKEIALAGWPVGAPLGSEEELRVRLEVSRSVLREALVLVEHHRAARMRRGNGGGLYVTAPDHGPATRAIILYLEHGGTGVADLVRARLMLEPLAAAGAAAHIGESDIPALRAMVLPPGQERGAPADIPAMDVFHATLGRLSGNPVLRLFLHVLIELTDRFATGEAVGRAGPVGEPVEHARRRIVEAVVAGDAHEARAAATRYMEGVAEYIAARPSRDRALRQDRPAPAPDGDAKLSELLAVRIHNEVVHRGWPAGELLGTETELLARYGVSRAVLREAVRILEHHAVATMRRGPSGGLAVTEPEPSAAVEMMALYLDYRRATREDLHAVREAVELGCLDLLLARRAEPRVTRALHAAVAAARDETATARVTFTEIAELAGNPVLTLFLHIVTELAGRHLRELRAEGGARGRAEVPDAVELSRWSRYSYGRIAEAVLAGDAALARHRLRRDLAEAFARLY